ncbi:MAG: MucR family transcriptional regulator [Alphaproteobacteria bacterium]|nr:MAG: MucR family transcriptional regulator [Alphaproteobacteria bacterium]
MSEKLSPAELLKVTADFAGSYITGKPLSVEEVQDVFDQMHKFFKSRNDNIYVLKTGPLVPAVPVEESVHADYIVCLEDGKKLQMLKRHLKTVYNMTPQEYRDRWSLPQDYPMVAPSYAEKRSQIAYNVGLGTEKTRKSKKRKVS